MTHQNGKQPKIRWSGWITVENYDWLCHLAFTGDRSLAGVINHLVRQNREKCSTVKNVSDAESHQK